MPVASMLYVFQVFLESLSDCVGCLTDILGSAFFASNGIN